MNYGYRYGYLVSTYAAALSLRSWPQILTALPILVPSSLVLGFGSSKTENHTSDDHHILSGRFAAFNMTNIHMIHRSSIIVNSTAGIRKPFARGEISV